MSRPVKQITIDGLIKKLEHAKKMIGKGGGNTGVWMWDDEELIEVQDLIAETGPSRVNFDRL